MAMPATGPIPAEVAKCFEGQAGEVRPRPRLDRPVHDPGLGQGRHLVLRQASSRRAASTARRRIDLVRNPNYSPSDRHEGRRENFPDEFVFIVNANADDIYNKIEAGELDTATSSIPPQVLKKYATTPSLKSDFHQNSGDRTWYLTMNLTQPPFDDVHVRRAMNWIMDKHALVQAWGGPTIGDVANHIVPDTLFNDQLADYDAVQDARRPRQRREGEGGDEGLEVRHEAATALCSAKRVQERAADRRHPRGRHRMLPVIEARREEDRHHLQGAHGQRVRTRRSRRPRRTSRSPSARAGARTTPTR